MKNVLDRKMSMKKGKNSSYLIYYDILNLDKMAGKPFS